MNDPISRIWDRWDSHAAPQIAAPLLAAPAALPQPHTIPPRAWLYGTRFIRGYVSVLAAPGGVGKSALALAQAACVATGRAFLGEHVHHATPAWVLNLEDPMDELDRRIAALMARHAIDRDQLDGRLFLHSGRTRRVCMATLSEGGGIAHPDQAAMIAAARAAGIGLIVIDPFVKSHQLDENANAEIDAAATAWAEIATQANAAILLVHHVRKGVADSAEATRGAKSLTDAARSVSLLTAMSSEEAQALGIADQDRWRLVRLDDAKANLAPRRTAASLWYRLETVALPNATPDYPSGDQVATITPWSQPATTQTRLAFADINRALDRIAAGVPPERDPKGQGGGLYTAVRRSGLDARWAGHILIDHFGLTLPEATATLSRWIRRGTLIEVDYHDPSQRKRRRGLRVNDDRRPIPSMNGDRA